MSILGQFLLLLSLIILNDPLTSSSSRKDRGGLGRQADVKRKQQLRERLEVESMRKRQKMIHQLRGDFRQRMREKFDDKNVGKDLHNSQKTCQYLDGVKVSQN